MVYLDYAKAFDKVDHGVLLHKIRDFGITGHLGKWLANFLSDRTQHVRLKGGISNDSPVISGVPQGTVLAPLLFTLLIADISDSVSSNIISFADDTRVYSHISTMTDSVLLQNDLKKIYNWSKLNNLTFNDTKFQHISFASDEKNMSTVEYINSSSNKITSHKSVKDLGIVVYSNLSFKNHIQDISRRCNQLDLQILYI